jgi:hypothetical protein
MLHGRQAQQSVCLGEAPSGSIFLVGLGHTIIYPERRCGTGRGNRRRQAHHHRRYRRAPDVFFGMEAEFWLNLQAHYDLAFTREALAENLAAVRPLEAAAVSRGRKRQYLRVRA